MAFNSTRSAPGHGPDDPVAGAPATSAVMDSAHVGDIVGALGTIKATPG
ncbi:hypothetical protein P3T36_003918 [Kitasatospora sp. MAP12-15]|nr:hypothetical protein [Kitasatospora sp. MAP12-44]MDH6108438.1 hypothetical protein [Kitasatospora sp. MAP12-44]